MNGELENFILNQISKLCENLTGDDQILVYFCNQTKSILQVGPTCGLVALLMAEDMLFGSKYSCEDNQVSDQDRLKSLLTVATANQLTKQGEMFTASHLARLAKLYLPVSVQVQQDLREQLPQIFFHSLQGNPVLIPYDKDANHEPCLKNGTKAHWAVVSGFCALLSKHDLNLIIECNNRTNLGTNLGTSLPIIDLQIYADKLNEKHIQTIFGQTPLKQVFLIFKQGKSKLFKMCDFEVMCRSNTNLFEIEPIRRDEGEYLQPEGGLEAQLNNRFLVIARKDL